VLRGNSRRRKGRRGVFLSNGKRGRGSGSFFFDLEKYDGGNDGYASHDLKRVEHFSENHIGRQSPCYDFPGRRNACPSCTNSIDAAEVETERDERLKNGDVKKAIHILRDAF
jgi:hypothetical protein